MLGDRTYDQRVIRMTAINAILSEWLSQWLKTFVGGPLPTPLPKGYFGSGFRLVVTARDEARLTHEERSRRHRSHHESTCYELVGTHLPRCLWDDTERIAVLDAFTELLESLQRGEPPTTNDQLLIEILGNMYEAMSKCGSSQRYGEFMDDAHRHLF